MAVMIALAQVEPATLDKQENLRKLDAFAERAANAGADLVVFPELSLTGYACGDAFFDVAEPVPGPSTLHVCEVARDLGLHVVWGMPERGCPASAPMRQIWRIE